MLPGTHPRVVQRHARRGGRQRDRARPRGRAAHDLRRRLDLHLHDEGRGHVRRSAEPSDRGRGLRDGARTGSPTPRHRQAGTGSTTTASSRASRRPTTTTRSTRSAASRPSTTRPSRSRWKSRSAPSRTWSRCRRWRRCPQELVEGAPQGHRTVPGLLGPLPVGGHGGPRPRTATPRHRAWTSASRTCWSATPRTTPRPTTCGPPTSMASRSRSAARPRTCSTRSRRARSTSA